MDADDTNTPTTPDGPPDTGPSQHDVLPVPPDDDWPAPPPGLGRWMTAAEAADHLRLTVRTLSRYVEERKLNRYHLVGSRQLRFLSHEVDALIVPADTTSVPA